MKICYYLCGVASALLLALPLHSATELGKLPLTTPMDTSAEVTQKIKDSSLKINGYDIEGNKLMLSDKFINDIDKVYTDGGQYVFTKLSDHPIFYNTYYIYTGNNKCAITNYVKPLYNYLTGERHYRPGYGDCFIRVGTNNPETAFYINRAGEFDRLTNLYAANKNSMPPEVKYLTIDDSMVLNNVLFNRSDLNIDGINVCTSNDIENVYTVTGFSDMIYTKTSDALVRRDLSSYNLYYKPIYYYSTHERVKYGVNTNSYITVGRPDGYGYPRLIYFEGDKYWDYEVYAVPTKANIPLPIQSISIDTDRIYNIVYGSWRLATNSSNIAIGRYANRDVAGNILTHWIAIGAGSRAWNHYSTAVGNSSASSNNAVAVGGYAKAFNTNSVAMGYRSAASNAFSIAIGGNAISVEDRTTAIGDQSVANHANATSVGSEVISHGVGTFNIYPDTMDKVYLKDNKLSDLVNTAITNQIANKVPSMIPPEKPEPTALLTNWASINIGTGARGMGGSTIAEGYYAYAGSHASIAIGKYATVTNCKNYRSYSGIAIGSSALASNNFAIAIGYYARATDANSTVITVGTNAVNSHGMNTFTVGLTDNDPLNYFYLGNSSLKSLLTNYDNSKVTATSIGALSSSEDINLADGKSINLTGGDFTINCNEDDIYDSAITAGWDSSQKRMKISLMGPSTEVVEPTGVILESGNISGDGGKISVLGGAGENSGGKLYVEATDLGTGSGQVYVKGVSGFGYYTPHITMIGGYEDRRNNSYHCPEITVGEVKVRESITNLNNSAITKIANQSVTGGNINLGDGLEFVGNNPLSQFDHKYYITYDTMGSQNYTAFTKASDVCDSSGAGYPLYREDGTRLTDDAGFYVNCNSIRGALVIIRPDSLETITGEPATFTEVPFNKQNNVINVSTNIAFKSAVELVKTQIDKVETDLETFKSVAPVFSNEYGQVSTTLTQDKPTLKISGSTSADSIELSPSDHNNGSTITLNSRNGGSRIDVNGGTYDGGVIRVRGPNVDSGEIQYSAAAIIAECLIPNQSIYIKSGYQGPDNIVPAEINIGDCKIRESINKLTNDVAVVANNLTNSQNVVIGKNANINDSESYAIAVGRSARVIGYSKDNSIAIGSYSLCKSGSTSYNCNIAIGSSAVATNYSGVAIGNGATVSHADSISIGDGAKSHRDSTFNINFSDPAPGLHNVYINDNNLTTLFDKRMHDINEAWILKDPDGNTRLLMPNYNTIYQIYDSAATGGFNVIEYLDGYSDGYKFTWNSYSGEMTLKVANSTNILILGAAPTDSSITFIDSNNRKYTVTRKKSYEHQTYFDDKINILLTKIQEMETTISNLTQQVNALQNP